MKKKQNEVKTSLNGLLAVKTKGAALFYAILISLLLGVICSTVLLTRYNGLMEHENISQQVRLVSNLQSARDKIEVMGEKSPQGWSDLFGESSDSVRIRTSAWGLFRLASVRVQGHGYGEEKTWLFGQGMKSERPTSLWVADMGFPLAVCGNTEICGKASLSASGFRSAYVEGKTFKGHLPAPEDVQVSEKQLPELSETLILNADLLSSSDFDADSVISLDPNRWEYSHSFRDRPLVIKLDVDSVSLENLEFSGHVIIMGAGAIHVAKSVKCLNVYVIAPRIYVEDGFRGSLQCLVSETFTSGTGVCLEYPSSVVCSSAVERKARIVLGEGNWLGGGIVLTSPQNADGIVEIGKESKIYGTVYSSNYLENRGSIYGTTYCRQTVVHTSSAVYMNHAIDATFDITKLPPGFVAPILFENEQWEEAMAF